MRTRPVIHDLTEAASGKEVWVVGDLHGRILLLTQFLHFIRFDRKRHMVISVGDLVDRGEDSPRVVEFFRQYGYAVRGNHERMWLELRENTGSFPYDEEGRIHPAYTWVLDQNPNGQGVSLQTFASRRIPPEDWLGYFDRLPTGITVGKYCVVHAGVLPGKPFLDHTEEELLWVREPYIFHNGPIPASSRNGKILITGHTQTFLYPGGLGQAIRYPDRVLLDQGAASNVGLGFMNLNTGQTYFIPGPNYETVASEWRKRA